MGEDVRRRVERLDEVDGACVLEDEERPEHEPDVADHVDHERLESGAVAVVRRYQNEISR